jgi:hypothetical protein
MNSRTIVVAFWAAAMAGSAGAQAPKFTRPAPTSADWAAVAKLPDFTGVWETPLGRGRDRTKPAPPVLSPEYAAKAKTQAASPPDESSTNCLPPGLPGIMTQPYPYEFLMTPGQVTIISEAYTQVRHIYTDGRPLPTDPDPTFYGTSVGRWEGNTLVAETVGFEQIPRGLPFPYSDKMKIVERFQLSDPETMTIETTVTDPEALTMPYAMGTRTLKRHRNWTLAEYVCEENNRNYVDAKGKAGVKLANPLEAPR